ncbi:hypothetical protein TB2_029743 [Malus domestica]
MNDNMGVGTTNPEYFDFEHYSTLEGYTYNLLAILEELHVKSLPSSTILPPSWSASSLQSPDPRKLSLNQPWPRCSTTSVKNQISRSPHNGAIVEVNTIKQAKLTEDASAYSVIVFDPLHNLRSVTMR